MRTIDRYIVTRFLWNFAVLFALLFIFAVSVDVALQLEEFSSAAVERVERTGEGSPFLLTLWALFSFYGPLIFQFYAYLCGMISVAAMGFTFGQMSRHRELVALLSAGVSLHRIGLPILAAALALNVLQLLNQELILPRLAPLLVRDHAEVLKPDVRMPRVDLTRDGAGNLISAARFNTALQRLEQLLVLERDEAGTARRRITATAATWEPETRCWVLEDGWVSERGPSTGGAGHGGGVPIDRYCTDLGPEGLAVRQSALYGQMLSLSQIRDMERYGGADPALLARYRYSRLAAVLVNLLMLLVTMPSFLRREPVNLLQQSVIAAAIAVPGLLGALIAMTVSLPGLPPAMSVFLPVAVLLPVAVARVSSIQS